MENRVRFGGKRACRLLAVLLLAGAIAAAAATPAQDAVAKPRPPVLPSWAPKRPSKEFLRAAKVLKPIPEEAQTYTPIYVPAWELFGSLTDQQVRQFLTPTQQSQPIAGMDADLQRSFRDDYQAKQVGDKLVYSSHLIGVGMGSFSPRQRAIFDALAEAWRDARKGTADEDLARAALQGRCEEGPLKRPHPLHGCRPACRVLCPYRAHTSHWRPLHHLRGGAAVDRTAVSSGCA